MSRQRRRRRSLRGQPETPPPGAAFRQGGLGRRTQVILVIATILLALAFAMGTPGLATLFSSGTSGGP